MRIKTVTTKSGINQVEFRDTDDRYYWIKNKGDNSILVSTEHPDTLADGEGITEIEPGQITLVENYGNVLYINGESEVEIREQDIPVCPFEGAGAALATNSGVSDDCIVFTVDDNGNVVDKDGTYRIVIRVVPHYNPLQKYVLRTRIKLSDMSEYKSMSWAQGTSYSYNRVILGYSVADGYVTVTTRATNSAGTTEYVDDVRFEI